MLYEQVKKNIEAHSDWSKEAIKCWEIYNGVTTHCPVCGIKPKELKDKLIQSQLSLIENEVERLRGEMKEYISWKDTEHYKECPDGCSYCNYAEGVNIGHNSVLIDQIDYLLEQKKLTKELL